MPIYEYVCQSCGQETEVMHKISEAPATDCPACGKSTLSKVVSAVGFRLKGGGWYETDFKSGGKKNVADDKTESKAADAPACGAGACPACVPADKAAA